MAETLFIVYILALSAGLGIASFGALLEIRARNLGLRTRRRARALILVKLGVALQSGILLWAIIPAGVVAPRPESFLFLLGTGVALGGLLMLVSSTIEETAKVEAKQASAAAEGRFAESEAGRKTAEIERAAGEEYRERGEEGREAAETGRVTAEERREEERGEGGGK